MGAHTHDGLGTYLPTRTWGWVGACPCVCARALCVCARVCAGAWAYVCVCGVGPTLGWAGESAEGGVCGCMSVLRVVCVDACLCL